MTSVDDLTWSQLRPQRVNPQCVLNSIPLEDMKSFLHIIATNPTIPFDETSAICSKIQSYRRWRYENAVPTTMSKPFSIMAPLKRNRQKSASKEIPKPDRMEIDDSDPENEQPERKQRRSSRPIPAESATAFLGNSNRGLSPKIGEDAQASVPSQPFSPEYWRKNPPKVSSQLVFSTDKTQGNSNLDKYLSSINLAVRRRDGFPLAPFALEVALEYLMKAEGDLDKAIKHALVRIPKGAYFPGIKKPFSYEEQCTFVGTLAEREKNFLYMSQHVLRNRSVSELTWMYYARYKQFGSQNNGINIGSVQEDRNEKHRKTVLNPSRAINALRRLAITPGDGFPVDSRAQSMLMACRRGSVNREKRRREAREGFS